MKFSILTIGKLKEAYLRDGVAEFVKRLRPYGGVTITELNESKIGDKPSDADRQHVVEEEGERLLKLVNDRSWLVDWMYMARLCHRKHWRRKWQSWSSMVSAR